MEEWLTKSVSRQKPGTIAKYTILCKNHISQIAGGLYITSIKEYLIEEYLYRKDIKSDSLIKSIYCVFNQIITYCNNYYNMRLVLLKRKKTSKNCRPVEIISKSDFVILWKWLYENFTPSSFGIILCLSTGLRLGEICALKWDDFDFFNQYIFISRTVQRVPDSQGDKKTKLIEVSPKSFCSKRIIPISDEICELAQKLYVPGSYVISQAHHTDPRTYQYRFQSILKNAAISKYNFHTLRHTFATNCIDFGIDVKSLSEILGHSSVSITLNKYVHPSMDTKREQLNKLSTIYGQYLGQETKESLSFKA